MTEAHGAASPSPDYGPAAIADLRRFRHDARNQLNLIVGYLELLGRPSVGILNDKQKMYVDRARAASDTLESLVDKLVTLSGEADPA